MKNILIVSILMLSAYAASAQDSLAVSDEAKSSAVVSRLTRELQLHKNQQEELRIVMQKRWSAINEYRKNGLAIDWISVNQQTVESLKGILSSVQYNQFVALRSETKRQKDLYKLQNGSNRFSDTDQELEF